MNIIFNTVTSIISILGAIASWIPFFSKKPELTLQVSVKQIPATQISIDSWSLIVDIKNTGNQSAENIELLTSCMLERVSTRCL